jgi:aspartate 1-decarboxylase
MQPSRWQSERVFLLPGEPADGGTDMRTMLKSKIHRAHVTGADLNYEGSITLDPILIEAAGLLTFELVHVLDITNGARLETYVIEGERGKGEVVINGAAAHLVHEGDLVIILAYASVSEEEAPHQLPRLIYVDEENKIASVGGAAVERQEAVA